MSVRTRMPLPPLLGPIGTFLGRLFPHALGLSGYLSLWDRQTKASIHVPIVDLIASEIRAIEIESKSHDCYFGVGLRNADLGSSRRGGRADVICIPGYWADVDFASDVHASEKLPHIGQAVELLDSFQYKPSEVIFSGYGMHVWWLFDQPYVFSSNNFISAQIFAKAFQDAFIQHYADKGFHVDTTSDLARVLRLPGTHNYKKPEAPKLVESILSSEVRYKYKDLDLRPRIIPKIDYTATNSKSIPIGGSSVDKVKAVLLQAKKTDTKNLFRKIVKGEAFAGEGERDTNLQKAASAIAFVDPETDPFVLAEILRPSLEAMQREATNTKNPPPTFEQAVDKISRAQEDAQRSRAKDEELRAVLIKQARPRPSSGNDRGSKGNVSAPTLSEGSGSNPGEGPFLSAESTSGESSGEDSQTEEVSFYTEEELVQFAEAQSCTVPELMTRIVIQKTSKYYVFVDGKYQLPLVKEELPHSLPRDLSPFGERIQWTVLKSNGETKLKTPEEMLRGITTVARRITANLTIDKSFYDIGEQAMHLAVCPKRKGLKPIYNEKIQKWLECLGGENVDKLLDWLATLTILDKQNSALYLSGAPGTGKTMLGVGMSRIWTPGGPTDLNRIMDNFNSDLLRCPLVFADEYIPQGHKVSSELRAMIASSYRILSQKFMDNFELIGSLRLMLCSNNDDLLQFEEDLKKDDQEAVAKRFLHLRVDQEARDYINSIGGRTGTDGWVDKDMIAQHVLWLIENRKVIPGERFLVEGFETEMHQNLSVNNRNSSLICEWLVRHIMNPNGIDSKAAKYIFIGQGKILVNANVFIEYWNNYMLHEKFNPSLKKITNALSTLRIGEERKTVKIGGKEEKLRYHVINTKLILTWADKNLIGDPDIILSQISSPTIIEVQPEEPTIN